MNWTVNMLRGDPNTDDGWWLLSAKTGFARHRGQNFQATSAPAQMAKAEDYVAFLMRG